MTLPSFRTTNFTEYPLQALQDNVATSLGPVLNAAILDHNHLTGLVIVAGTPLLVNHQLGRAVTGWFMTDLTTQATVWRSPTLPAGADPTRQLQLNASATCTVAIWVF